MKTTLMYEFEDDERSEIKGIVGINDLRCVCFEFESKLRELWKYDQKGMDYDTIEKIREMWFDITEDARWVLE